jgi:hypothetical protein
MKKLLVSTLILLSSAAFAQSNTTDTNTKADASNSGINFNTANNGSTYAANPVNPGGLPPSTGCVLSTVTSGSVGWNAISGSTSSQTIAKHCIYYEAIKNALAMCQYKTAHMLYDKYIKEELGIDASTDHSKIQNLSVVECSKQNQQKEPVKESPKPQPDPVVTPPQTLTIVVDMPEQKSCNAPAQSAPRTPILQKQKPRQCN